MFPLQAGWKIHPDQVPACYLRLICLKSAPNYGKAKYGKIFRLLSLTSGIENYFASSTPNISALTNIAENRDFLKWLTLMWGEKLKVWLRLCSNLNHRVDILLIMLVKNGCFSRFIRVVKSFGARKVVLGRYQQDLR